MKRKLYSLGTALAVSYGIYYYFYVYSCECDIALESPYPELRPLLEESAYEYELIEPYPAWRFKEPVDFLEVPGVSRQFLVLERGGKVWATTEGSEPVLVLDISDRLSQKFEDDGALGIRLHPGFAQGERRVFVFYTAHHMEGWTNRLSEFFWSVGKHEIDANSEKILIDQFDRSHLHNGGSLAFDEDGYLYVSIGDEGISRHKNHNPQGSESNLFGSVLRLDVDNRPESLPLSGGLENGQRGGYKVPADNPFVNEPGVLGEYYALGLRSPHRMSFDRETGKLWLGDVGSGIREEINVIRKGGNYQWNYREGSVVFSKSPLRGEKPSPYLGIESTPYFEYSHQYGDRCVIGGYVYRGKKLAGLVGKYVFADNVSGRIWSLPPDVADPKPHLLAAADFRAFQGISSFAEDLSGELYVLILGDVKKSNGRILQLKARPQRAGSELAKAVDFSKTGILQGFGDDLELKRNFIPLQIANPSWQNGARSRFWMRLPAGGDGKHKKISLQGGDVFYPEGTIFVQHLDRPGESGVLPMETRVMQLKGEGPLFARFVWNKDKSLALPSEVSVCGGCHNAANGFVLNGGIEQIRSQAQYDNWSCAELATEELLDDERWDGESSAEVVVAEERIVSYLRHNCGYCHKEGGAAPGQFRVGVDAKVSDWLGKQPDHDFGIEGARLLLKGDPEHSLILRRLESVDPMLAMPPYDKHAADDEFAMFLRNWLREG